MNKRLIVLFAGLILLVLIVVLNSTVFTVSKISVSSDDNGSWYDSEEIIASSLITKGKNIFIISETKAIENIQNANSYVRVTSIERIFPNNIIIHISLRVPVIAIKVEGADEYLITDWELNVIDAVPENDPLYNNSTLITGLAVTVTDSAEELIGTKLINSSLESVTEITIAAATLGITDIGFETFFESIDFGTSHYAKIKTNSGVTFILVVGTDLSVSDQLQAVYSIFISLDATDPHRTSGYYKHNEIAWIWSQEADLT